jgi:hypothetical protein
MNYYTPKIEEFCVGFEYELKKWISPTAFEWQKSVINKSNDIHFVDMKLRDPKMDGTQIRVKYLDKEDIESLGFYERIGEYYTQDQEYQLSFLEKFNRWYIIEIGDTPKYCNLIFRGIIKNKHELHLILKMLGITN